MILADRQSYEKKSKDELIDEIDKQMNEIERLKRELRRYKNSDTPPSANQHLKQDKPLAKTGCKRGAPKNHPGITRPWKIADETRKITADECPECHSHDVSIVGTRHQQVEEMPPDIKPTVVDVYRDVCKCNSCKLKFDATDGRTPLQGRFGVNLMVLMIFLKFIVRGVLRKTSRFLEAGFALQITPASVNAILSRAANAAENEYEKLKRKIRVARIVYVDETSFSVLGAKWWVWVFRSDSDVLLVIRHDRGNSVVKEVLTEAFNGIVVCDGWRAYDCLTLADIQRCWAHLLRKSAELKSAPGKHFHKKLERFFVSIKRFNRKPRTEKARLKKYARLTGELQETIEYYSRYSACEGVTKYVRFRLDEWFTCVRLDDVEPTNNYAEQAIRETVMVRKIIGAFRSRGGVKVYENLASLLATWQFQQLDITKELNRMLTKGLC